MRTSSAQARVHAGVQAEIVKKRAEYVADVLNSQLIPPIVLLNYGTLDVPMPELRFKIPQEGVTLERVQVAKTALEIKGMKLKKSEVYEFIGFAQPSEGDEVFESAADEPKDGFSALFGKGKSGNDTDPDDDPPQPKKKAPAKPEDAAEPVSAAKSPAPTDPAQEWLAPIKEKFLEARRAGASMADLKKMLLTMHPNTKALAKAFANNILAGFAGESEEVDAANPYGCNQYKHIPECANSKSLKTPNNRKRKNRKIGHIDKKKIIKIGSFPKLSQFGIESGEVVITGKGIRKGIINKRWTENNAASKLQLSLQGARFARVETNKMHSTKKVVVVFCVMQYNGVTHYNKVVINQQTGQVDSMHDIGKAAFMKEKGQSIR